MFTGSLEIEEEKDATPQETNSDLTPNTTPTTDNNADPPSQRNEDKDMENESKSDSGQYSEDSEDESERPPPRERVYTCAHMVRDSFPGWLNSLILDLSEEKLTEFQKEVLEEVLRTVSTK